MRRLMYLTMGFAAACGSCAYIDSIIGKGMACMIMLVLLCMIDRKHAFVRKMIPSVLGCLLGFFWFSGFHIRYVEPILPLNEQTLPLSIRAADYGKNGQYGTGFDGTLEISGRTYQIQVRLQEEVAVEPGMVFFGNFYLRANVGGIHAGQGIFLSAYQRDELTVTESEEQWPDRIVKLRRDILQDLEDVFPEDTRAFAGALFLGDTSGLEYDVDTNLKVSGIRHVVAVSGLHISILFGILSMITFRRRFLTAFVGYPVLFFFAALTGFTPSVVRACLMSGLMLLANVLDREYDGPTSLSVAVLIMLVINPLMITDVGFQLSVSSVAGIFLFSPGIVKWLGSFVGDGKGKSLRRRLLRGMIGSVSVTLGATVFTAPISAYYFGTVSLVGLVTNLLCLWAISIAFYGIMLVCLVCRTVGAAAGVIAKLVAWLIRYALWVAETMADFPLAAVFTASPYITAWMVFLYVLLVLFLISKNRKPRIFACCAVIGLCLALTADWVESSADDVRITVLDVGQGQCILLQSEGRSFLVDCGGTYGDEAADQASEALLRQGIGKLDGLILTHLDQDHSNGVKGLLSRVETELLILPETYSELPALTEAQLICVRETIDITFENTAIHVYPATFPGNDNEKSLCVLFDTQKCDILITGDRDAYGERSLLRNETIPDVDILIAGHHGAASSTCEELLEAVKPEIVCISAGAGNFYGHPAPELLQRLAEYGCHIYRTDVQGSITIRR